MAASKNKIETAGEYAAAIKRIDALMRLGEDMNKKDATELRKLALAAQAYEKNHYEIPAPKTVQGMLELEMFKRKLRQKEMAKLLNIGEAKLSQILSNKRVPDLALLKAANEKLGIDGNLLLRYA
ncbi:MAG: Helix-turn-helix domain protein [Flaviaesturariibacter sp.]|nr:Helix-turn-helix domain protein [Flaviaesturariibacter sp.]